MSPYPDDFKGVLPGEEPLPCVYEEGTDQQRLLWEMDVAVPLMKTQAALYQLFYHLPFLIKACPDEAVARNLRIVGEEIKNTIKDCDVQTLLMPTDDDYSFKQWED